MDAVLAVLSLAGTIVLVVAIWYCGSLAVLALVSKVFPLTGRRAPRPPDSPKRPL